MRIATRVCVAAMAVAALNLSGSAAEVLSPDTPTSTEEKGSAQAQVWFEQYEPAGALRRVAAEPVRGDESA
jgi:hypothetical protein